MENKEEFDPELNQIFPGYYTNNTGYVSSTKEHASDYIIEDKSSPQFHDKVQQIILENKILNYKRRPLDLLLMIVFNNLEKSSNPKIKFNSIMINPNTNTNEYIIENILEGSKFKIIIEEFGKEENS